MHFPSTLRMFPHFLLECFPHFRHEFEKLKTNSNSRFCHSLSETKRNRQEKLLGFVNAPVEQQGFFHKLWSSTETTGSQCL